MMARCPYCSGTDYAHEIGDECYYEYLMGEEEQADQAEPSDVDD